MLYITFLVIRKILNPIYGDSSIQIKMYHNYLYVFGLGY